jgi:hypothetical protein
MTVPEESPKDTAYFRNLLEEEKERLSLLCNSWEEKLVNLGESIPEDIQGSIRSVAGQGRLVMKERFSQFSGLVDNCEFSLGEKETTTTDLMGFWEMIYYQVRDVDSKFSQLSLTEANQWTAVEEIIRPPTNLTKKSNKNRLNVVRKEVVKNTNLSEKPKSDLRALIALKRKEQKSKSSPGITVEAIEVEKKTTPDIKIELTSPKDNKDLKQFDGGFFKISTPGQVKTTPITKSTGGIMRNDKTRNEMCSPAKGVTTRSMAKLLRMSRIGKINAPAPGSCSPVKTVQTRTRLEFKEDEMDKDIFENEPSLKNPVANRKLKSSSVNNCVPSAS